MKTKTLLKHISKYSIIIVLYGCMNTYDREDGCLLTPLGHINLDKVGSRLEQEFTVPDTDYIDFFIVTDDLTKTKIKPLKLHIEIINKETSNVIYNRDVDGTNLICYQTYNTYTKNGYNMLALDIPPVTDRFLNSLKWSNDNKYDVKPEEHKLYLKSGSVYSISYIVLNPALVTNQAEVYYFWHYTKKPDFGIYWTNKYGLWWTPESEETIYNNRLNTSGGRTGIYSIVSDNGNLKTESDCKNGVREGKYVEWYPSGEIRMKGYYTNNVPDGKWTVYSENGVLVDEHTYKEGKPDGIARSWYTNGNVRSEENSMMGERHGIYQTWYINGALRTSGEYYYSKQKGKRFSWYENGEKCHECTYSNGVKYGMATFWFDNGQREKQGLYLNGKKHGNWQLWNRNGTLKETILYNEGKKVK